MKSIFIFLGLIALLVIIFGQSLGEAIWSGIVTIIGIIGFIVIAVIICNGFSSFADWLCKDKKHTNKKG